MGSAAKRSKGSARSAAFSDNVDGSARPAKRRRGSDAAEACRAFAELLEAVADHSVIRAAESALSVPQVVDAQRAGLAAMLEPSSIPLMFSSGQAVELPLFASLVWQSDAQMVKRVEPGTVVDSTCFGSASFTGGSVWAMDWCPLPADEATDQYIALAANRLPEHHLKQSVGGLNVIQIWNMGPLTTTAHAATLESIMICESECIWDLKWHPSPGNARSPSAAERGTLGCLAVARGDGVILLLSVPWTPRSRAEPAQVTEVTPIMRCQPGEGLAWVLAWSHQFDGHTRLFFGCQDGTAGVIDTLTRPTATDQLAVPELMWQAHSGSVRRNAAALQSALGRPQLPAVPTCWLQVRCVAPSPTHSFIVATTGHDGLLRFWDTRQPALPLQVQHSLSVATFRAVHCLHCTADNALLVDGLGVGVGCEMDQPHHCCGCLGRWAGKGSLCGGVSSLPKHDCVRVEQLCAMVLVIPAS